MKRYQCTECDKESSDKSDFKICKQNNHKIILIEVEEKRHTEYAKEIMSNIHFKTIRDTQETLYYENGVYKTNAETLVNSECETLIPNCTSYMRREVLRTIQALTYVEREQFDADPVILNLKNGLLNIETGDFRKHIPQYLSRIQLPINFDPSKGPITFMKFLMSCLPDTSSRNTVIEEFSSILLGDAIRLEKIFMYVGGGANGKSTFLSLIESIIGHENISHVSIHDLIFGRFARSQLDGKLANIFADITNDELTKIGILKALVSGDSIDVEKKGKPHFTMKNRAKMFFSCNQLPEINEDSDAVYRRFVITEWNQKFIGKDDNKNLIHELTTEDELSGILNLLLFKAKRLLNTQKLTYEQTSEQLRLEWKENADPVKLFIKEKITKTENQVETKSNVYSAYVEWCKQHNILAKSESEFTKKFKSNGFMDDSQRVRNGTLDPKGKTTRIWLSVTLVTPLHLSLRDKQNQNDSISLAGNNTCNNVTDVTKRFLCKTCNAGPFSEDAISMSSGNIIKFHRKLGHEVTEYLEDN